ncbi:MAG: aldehyde dehydrogenase family protein [Ignavibacteriales bacterium]|nr:aldehyde dehydrogenase family protein [Ignavibacteriales bacterium]
MLVHSSIERQLLDAMKRLLQQYYSQNRIGENFMAIVNERHFDRIKKLTHPKKIFYGGVFDKSHLFISPTIMNDVTFDDDIMQDEIFGPVLPVVRYENLNDTIAKVKEYPKPLSLYVFGSNGKEKERLFNELSFGGGSLNDAAMYFVNDHLPLGGIGASGIGSYHVFEGFRTFSNYKAIMEKSARIEFWLLKSPPYSAWKEKLLRLLIEKF